jgi:hypothetical protein
MGLTLGCDTSGEDDNLETTAGTRARVQLQVAAPRQVSEARLRCYTLEVEGPPEAPGFPLPSSCVPVETELTPVSLQVPIGPARRFRLSVFTVEDTEPPRWRGCALADVPATGTTVMLPLFARDAVDYPLSIQTPGDQTNAAGTAIPRLPILVHDPDCSALSNALRYEAANLPPALTIDPLTGLISGVIAPTAAAGSPYNVRVTASHETERTSSTFPWVVTPLAPDQVHLLAGAIDHFALPPDPATPSTALVASVRAFVAPTAPDPLFQDFDQIAGVNGGSANLNVGHTFMGLPATVVAASLTLRVRPGAIDVTTSDGIIVSFVDAPTTNYATAIVYKRTFGQYAGLPPGPGVIFDAPDPGLLQSTPWGPSPPEENSAVTFTLDLAALPLVTGATLNLIDALNQRGFLDVVVSDETGVDYMYLSLTTRPSP